MILTIGIPTYNGAATIKNALESIIGQNLDEIYTGNVEVLISDNASVDNTEEVVKNYVAKFPDFIRYEKHSHNLAYDRNVDSLFQKARGEYIWLLGDDDELSDGGIKTVLAEISKNDCDYMLCNYSIKKKNEIIMSKVFDIQREIILTDKEGLFELTSNACGFMSANIMQRDTWLQVENDKFAWVGWIHFFKILNSENLRIKIINKPLVLLGQNDVGWTKNGNMIIVVREICHVIYESKASNRIKKALLDKYKSNLENVAWRSINQGLTLGKRIDCVKVFARIYKSSFVKEIGMFVLPVFLYKVIKMLFIKPVRSMKKRFYRLKG